MIELKSYPTGRPCYVDPDRVGGVFDLLTAEPPRMVGAAPQLTVVGTRLLVDGAPMDVHGEAPDVFRELTLARRTALPAFPPSAAS